MNETATCSLPNVQKKHSNMKSDRGKGSSLTRRRKTASSNKQEISHSALNQVILYDCERDSNEQCWYTQEDYVEMLESLDSITRQRKQHIAGVRRFYVNTILDLQDEHKSNGIDNFEDVLAKMASRCTRYSRRDAMLRATDLASEVARYQQRDAVLNVIDSVLDIMKDTKVPVVTDDDADVPSHDSCLRPPKRLLSP